MLTSVASDGMVVSDTPMEEGSGVFFLSLLTSLSLTAHSLTHFVIPVSSLIVIPGTHSHDMCSHHHIVIPDFSLESSHPTHLIVIPVFTHP